MAEFTFLKLQFDDVSFAANAPFSAGDEAKGEAGEDEDDDSRAILPLVLGLVFLVVVAVVVKKFLGGDSELPAIDAEADEA